MTHETHEEHIHCPKIVFAPCVGRRHVCPTVWNGFARLPYVRCACRSADFGCGLGGWITASSAKSSFDHAECRRQNGDVGLSRLRSDVLHRLDRLIFIAARRSRAGCGSCPSSEHPACLDQHIHLACLESHRCPVARCRRAQFARTTQSASLSHDSIGNDLCKFARL